MSAPGDDDIGGPGFWFGLVGAIVALGTLGMQWLDRARSARQTEVSFLNEEVASLRRQVADHARSRELCEMRCEELREEMLELMAQVATKRKRKRA